MAVKLKNRERVAITANLLSKFAVGFLPWVCPTARSPRHEVRAVATTTTEEPAISASWPRAGRTASASRTYLRHALRRWRGIFPEVSGRWARARRRRPRFGQRSGWELFRLRSR